jgi:hypothetical protein
LVFALTWEILAQRTITLAEISTNRIDTLKTVMDVDSLLRLLWAKLHFYIINVKIYAGHIKIHAHEQKCSQCSFFVKKNI